MSNMEIPEIVVERENQLKLWTDKQIQENLKVQRNF